MGRYLERAVDALYLAIAGNGDGAPFDAALSAVETENELEANSIGRPLAYLTAFVGNDTRARLVMIDDGGSSYGADENAGQRNGLAIVDCGVVMAVTGDLDVEAGKLELRRWVTAMIETVRNANASITDPRVLGFRVGQVDSTTGQSQLPGQPDVVTRHYAILDVEVIVHEG